VLSRCQEIKRRLKQIERDSKPKRRNQSVAETIKAAWDETYLKTEQYQDIPLDIFRLFLDRPARDVAAVIIARRFGIEPTTFVSHVQPEIARIRKSLTNSPPNK
jgi:hypothetical protein